jgi:hypothetical protein
MSDVVELVVGDLLYYVWKYHKRSIMTRSLCDDITFIVLFIYSETH